MVCSTSYLSVVRVLRHTENTLRRLPRRCSILEHLHVLQVSMHTRLASNMFVPHDNNLAN